MKFSKAWVNQWVETGLSDEALAEQITMAGLEVDGVEPVAGEFNNVVIGQVVDCKQHPDADKLRVTKVDVGDDELLDIVCGAANCRTGLKVVVAKVGATLPGGFKIKKAKLRGQPSHGMLCAEEELGMAESSDGITELPQDAPIGMDIREYLELNDVQIEVDLTSNRADCFSIKGLAREISALNRIPMVEPEWQAVEHTGDELFPVTVTDHQACPRYLGRIVRNVDVTAATPLWMVERLRRSGIRSIDPVVDITNYVMIEQGQPMHAFDLEKLSGGINVRLANEGEKLVLLDGNEVSLKPDTLLITDQSGPIAMAGIFGGEHTGVTAESKHILLESAFFAPLAIRGRSRQYGLHTDSSHRFERGVDYQLQARAMERATQLLVEICGGDVHPINTVESEADLPKPNTVTLRRSKLDSLIGHHIGDDDVSQILELLGMPAEQGEGTWTIKAPSYRFDMAIEEDLVEEVARIYGYNNIPNVAPMAHLSMNSHREADLNLARVRNTLVDLGYQEAITYSFVDPKRQSLLHPEIEPLVLPQPISVEMSAMRVSLFTGLIDAVVHNQNRQQGRVRMFEAGLRFIEDSSAENGVRQEPMLAAVITDSRAPEQWDGDVQPVDFFDLKGDLEAIFALTADTDSFSFRKAEHSALHPGQCAEILRDDQVIGVIGTIHPSLEKKLGLKSSAILFEIQQSALLERRIPEAVPVSRFPANRRDIAILVKEEVYAGDVLKTIQKSGGNQLVGINLFDVYRGKGVTEGEKSLAISLQLQDLERTLEEKEIAETVQTIVEALAQEFNASLRD